MPVTWHEEELLKLNPFARNYECWKMRGLLKPERVQRGLARWRRVEGFRSQQHLSVSVFQGVNY